MANRTIKLYKNYFKEFYVAQSDAVRRKINYCINVVRTVDRVPKTILKIWKMQMDYMKSVSKSEVIYSESSVALTKALL